MRGPWQFLLGFYPSDEGVHEQAERYRHPFLTAKGTGAAGELGRHEGPALEGDRRVVLTALRRDDARLVNESAEPQTVQFDGSSSSCGPGKSTRSNALNANYANQIRPGNVKAVNAAGVAVPRGVARPRHCGSRLRRGRARHRPGKSVPAIAN